ncbi:MAG TPA: hypothetical protein PLO25_00725 [Candidatus Saccharibacteria bacterium]|nr:hypothetical protein [Candidatus Saccharibacteria bacterium]
MRDCYTPNELMLKQKNEAQFVELFQISLTDEKFISRTEVPTAHGIADLVLVKPLDKKVAIRQSHEQVYNLTNENFFQVLDNLPDRHKRKKGITINDLTSRVHISDSYLKHKVLKKLIEEGFVVNEDTGYFKINGWLPLASKVIAYEAKLYDWKQGLYQANRYRYFADETYLLMPAETVHRAKVEEFERTGVGLVSFDMSTSRKCVIVKAGKHKDDLDLMRRYTVMEYFLDQMLTNRAHLRAL